MQIDLVSQLASASIRAVGLGLVTVVGLGLLRIRSSAARHATWTVALVGMLLQIPLGVMAPGVSLKAPVLHAPIALRLMNPARTPAPAVQAPALGIHTRTEPQRRRMSWSATLTGLYLAISILMFARMALGFWSLRRILRDRTPLPNLGPHIFESAAFVVPGSVGCFRAIIFLPSTRRDWNAEKLRAVLAHENAHVLRQDWLIRVASRANVCIFWFHPLAWWLERELALLAEEACDDVALSGLNREEYAATLVDIARTAHGAVLNWQVIPMAKNSNVVRRVNRILEARLPMPKPFGRLAWVTLLAFSLPMIYLSAAVKLTSANRDSTSPKYAAVSTPVEQIAQAAPNPPLRPPPPSGPEDKPLSMCILLDSSGSMYDKRAAVKAAALALVKASKAGDEVCIAAFNDEVFSSLPHGEDFTSDPTEMEDALTHIEARGGKALRDAVRISIDQMNHTAHNAKKVVVVITDGFDSASTLSQERLLSEIGNSGVPIYCIGLLRGDDPSRAASARLALEQLARTSGGLDYYPADLAEVESIAPGIANAIRKQ